MMRERIFERGEGRDGEQISSYSTKPTYISKSQMRRTGLGTETRGGKSKKFTGGYAQYKRELNGTGNFDLRNFGVMQRDFQSPMEQVSGRKLQLTFKQDRSKAIAQKYPNAWNMNAAEREKFSKTFADQLKIKILDNA
jgi:hypothetical protein